MRLTIVPSDGMVGVDGEFRVITGLAAMFPSIHAVQWVGEAGHIEFNDGTANEVITTLATIQAALDAWNALTPAPPTAAELLAESKVVRLAAISASYDIDSTANIVYAGSTFQADASSQAMIASVLTASGGFLPAGFQWYGADNQPVVMTFSGLQTLAGMILMRAQPLFAAKQVKKDAIRSAATVAEVEAVTW